MTRAVFVWAMLGLLGVVCNAAQQSARIRRVFIGDQPVLSQLRPDDEVVELVPPEIHVAVGMYKNRNDAFIDAVSRSVIIAIGRVQDAEAQLTESGTSIERRLTFVIEEPLVTRPGFRRASGDAVTVGVPGGELRTGGVVIRTAYQPQYLAGEAYLLFLDYVGRGKPMEPVTDALLIRAGRTVGPFPEHDLHGLSIRDLVPRIRKLGRTIN